MIQPEQFESSPKAEAFEAELADALEAIHPPQGFADRVLARAGCDDRPVARLFLAPARTRWAVAAIAAMLLAGVVTTEELHLRREKARTEQAERQFQTAVGITSAILQDVREQLQQIDIPAVH